MKFLFYKKRYLIFILLFSFLFLVSAQTRVGVPEIGPAVEKLAEALIEAIKKIDFGFIEPQIDYLLDLAEKNSYNIMRIFFGLLLFFFIYGIVDTMQFFEKYKKSFNLILSISITALSMIAMPKPFLDFLIPAYESMASVILMVPLGFLFYVSLKARNQIFGRLIWLFLTVFFVLLFFAKGLPEFLEGDMINGFLYLSLALIGILMVVFLPAIRKWFFKGEIAEIQADMARGVEIEEALRQANLKQAKALRDISNSRN